MKRYIVTSYLCTTHSQKWRDINNKFKETMSDESYSSWPCYRYCPAIPLSMKNVGKPIITLSSAALSKLIIVLITLHVISIIYSLLLLIAAVKLKTTYGDYVNMVTHSDGHILPLLSSVAGLLSLPLGAYGLFLSIKVYRLHKQPARSLLILFYILATCTVAICNFCVIVAAAVHAYQVQGKLHDGIMSAMENYRTNIHDKVTIDTLQIKFKCCGSKNYKDWFQIAWIDPNLGGVPARGDFVSDDVPFSCCSGAPMRPCIHHRILSASNIYRYDPQRQLSVSAVGCHNVLVSVTKTMVQYMAGFMTIFSLLQIAVALVMRIVQTALSKHGQLNVQKTGKHMAWIFGTKLFYRRKRKHKPLRQESDTEHDTSTESEIPQKATKRKKKWFKPEASSSETD